MPDLLLASALVLAWWLIRRPPRKAAGWVGRTGGNREWYRTVYLSSPHWIATAKAKRKEAGYKCEDCHKSKPLDVHHLTYERLGHERMSDLRALCRSCHKKHDIM